MMTMNKFSPLSALSDQILIKKYEELAKLAQLYKRNKELDLLNSANESMDQIDKELQKRYK